jgi:hypothetical protein
MLETVWYVQFLGKTILHLAYSPLKIQEEPLPLKNGARIAKSKFLFRPLYLRKIGLG